MNRLAEEKSPYLRQHAQNPVNWFPWGEEAFALAQREDKPVFLSIGYSTCHWCHVMEKESFEDPDVAAFLNENFVSIKVDREERPDIDHVYMTACQALTGAGGWPLTVFLTPDKKPFYAGTYFPRDSRHGLPGLMAVLQAVINQWDDHRDEIARAGENLVQSIRSHLQDNRAGVLSESTLHLGYRQLFDAFDPHFGGFGPPPKFPRPHDIGFLLRYWRWNNEPEALAMVETTLKSMRAGGIYDHLGYGFSRYSTDRAWLVPHFEKMLYDNALLAVAYLETYQATADEFYAEVANEIFQYVLRDMTSAEGGFYSAEDADSEGEEGKFYLWTPEEIKAILGEETGERFCLCYDVTEAGNFEGKNILNRIGGAEPSRLPGGQSCAGELAEARERLFVAREGRVHPQKDDKILTSWNALMITALARGSRILDKTDYLRAAVGAAQFIWENLRGDDGRLLARYRAGEAAHPAYADDYAFLVRAMLALYDADMKPIWLRRAIHLQEQQDRLFWDEQGGGYYFYGHDAEVLPARPKAIDDGAMPSGNSTSVLNLWYLGRLTGHAEYSRRAESLLESFSGEVQQHPSGYTKSLTAMLIGFMPGREVVVASEQDSDLLRQQLRPLARVFSPETTFLYRLLGAEHSGIEEIVPLTAAMEPENGETTFYVCRNYACEQPTRDLCQVLDELRS